MSVSSKVEHQNEQIPFAGARPSPAPCWAESHHDRARLRPAGPNRSARVTASTSAPHRAGSVAAVAADHLEHQQSGQCIYITNMQNLKPALHLETLESL